MIKENKTTKYLLYTIGEILLVVIGILIALQVDTANESRKNKDFELKMLTEVRNDLIGDLDYLKTYTIYCTEVLDSALNTVLKHVHNKVIFHDSIYRSGVMTKLEFGAVLKFNKGSYEAIKSVGIDRITNDSLRNQLINHYDFELPFWTEIISEYTNQYEPQLAFLSSMLGEPQVTSYQGKVIVYRRYPKNIFQLPEFKLFIWKAKIRTNGTKSAIKEFIPKIQETIDLINIELDKN